MNPTAVGLTGIIVLLCLMFLFELPVGLAMGIVGAGGLWCILSPDTAATMIGNEIWSVFTKYGLTVIPMFILMGQICFYCGVNQNLYRTAYTWMGRTRGGLAMATIMACAGFAAICGSNTATAATMTAVALPEMKKYRYDSMLSSSAIAVGSTLGVVIPPSVVLIVYGIYTEQSIGKLFWGSTVPGIIMAILFCLTVYIMCLIRPELGPGGEKKTFLEKIKSIPGATEMIVLFSLVMAGLYSGAYTPTEAGAAGAFFAIILGLIRRKLTWKGFLASVIDTLKVSCMIIVIVTGAVFRGFYHKQVPFEVRIRSRAAVQPCKLLSFSIIYMMRMVMDALGFLLVSIPIFFPVVVTKMGYDPIWFGCIICLVTTLGAVTPPVGICAYVVSGMSKDIPLGTIFRGVGWYLPAYWVVILLMLFYPQVALFLPSFVK